MDAFVPEGPALTGSDSNVDSGPRCDARRPSSAHGNADAGTQRAFALSIVVGIGFGLWAPSAFPSARLVDGETVVFAGIALAACGLALRWWSVRTLGRFFRRSVTIEADHSLSLA